MKRVLVFVSNSEVYTTYVKVISVNKKHNIEATLNAKFPAAYSTRTSARHKFLYTLQAEHS